MAVSAFYVRGHSGDDGVCRESVEVFQHRHQDHPAFTDIREAFPVAMAL